MLCLVTMELCVCVCVCVFGCQEFLTTDLDQKYRVTIKEIDTFNVI